MKLTVINSNSTGNAYILESTSGEALLVECGVSWEQIKKALGFNLKKVVGCIVTHEHLDHCKSALQVMAAGINVWATLGTHDAMETTSNHRACVTKGGTHFYCGEGFKVMAFDTKHDCAEPVGYIIHHDECGSVLFLTDSYYSEYKFTNLNNIIIEANYCQKILDKRVIDGTNPKFLRDRVITSHMSLATCKLTLLANDLSQVNNIVLIHLSDGNSDAARFKTEVQEATGKTVHVAAAGMEIENFNKKPF